MQSNMRTIKFRAWNGYSMYSPTIEGTYDISVFLSEIENLMQFTGLVDKNGKEIFEGDIIKYVDYNNTPYFETVDWVEYDDSCIDCGTASGFCIINPKKGEVIGNIYENPELIK